jgi:hypothetical protein
MAGILRDRRVMDEEEINRARLRSQLWRENRHLFNRNEGVGELPRLSEEELEERDEAVALQMEGLAPSLNYATRIASYKAELMRREVVLQRERMEELTANLVRQRVDGDAERQPRPAHAHHGSRGRRECIAQTPQTVV